MEAQEFRDLQAVLQPDQEIASRHQTTHQGELCGSVDVATQEIEGQTPIVITKVIQLGPPTGGFDQRIAIEGNDGLQVEVLTFAIHGVEPRRALGRLPRGAPIDLCSRGFVHLAAPIDG